MPEGAFRRPPQLWEQKLSAMVGANSVGTVAGSSTSEVGSDLTPGDGGPPPEAAVIPPSPTAFSMPSTPTLSGGVQSLMVTWDGNNSNGDPYPYETAVVEIHISTTSGFSPSSATLRGELAYAGSHTITGLSAGVTYYVVLRGRDGQGNFSAVSTQASGQTGLTTSSDYGNASILPGSVSFDARAIGGIATTVGSTAPTSPISGDIWLDTTGGATVHKRWSGSAWITQAWGSDSLSANCITAVQVAAGAITAGAIAANAVTAASIAADAIDGKVITGATIRTSATAGTSTAPRAGLVIDTAGLRGFDASGNQTININASTGAVTIGAYQPAGTYLTPTDVGAGGSTVISGDRITTGTITARKFQTSTSGNRIVLADATNTYGADSIAFVGAGAHLYPSSTLGLVCDGKFWISNSLFVNGVSTFFGNATASGDFTVDGTFDANAGVTLGTSSGSPAVRIDTSGNVYSLGISNATAGGTANVVCATGASSQLRLASSTVRIKTDVRPLADGIVGVPDDKMGAASDLDARAVLDIVPAEFESIAADAGSRYLGFIAEDVAAKLPMAAEYDADGQPRNVDTRAILAALLAVVQQQQQTITELTARVEALEAK